MYKFGNLLYFLTILFFLHPSKADTIGCILSQSPQDGLVAKFYSYPNDDMVDVASLRYMSYGFMYSKHLGEIGGVTNIDINNGIACKDGNSEFECSPYNGDTVTFSDYALICNGISCGSVETQYGTVFGFEITTMNYTVEIVGYLLASQTGSYKFTMESIDDSAQLSIGAGIAFDCCNSDETSHNTDFTINAVKGWNQDAAFASGSTDLEKGFYYPFQLVYTNAVTFGHLKFQMILPDGTIVSDLDGHVFSLPENFSGQCMANIVKNQLHRGQELTLQLIQLVLLLLAVVMAMAPSRQSII